MAETLLVVAMMTGLGQNPYSQVDYPPEYGHGGWVESGPVASGPVMHQGYVGGGEVIGSGGFVGGGGAYPPVSPGAYGEPMYPYDSQEPWLHGYFQHMPAYRGHAAFRPYNYKHVLSQSQTAAGWGIDPHMAYSQQFWHRYQKQASLNETSYGSGTSSTDSIPQPKPEPETLGRWQNRPGMRR